ncbi:hypothetical protein [Candidatus Dormiibacter inghamiae]|uniref:hypothetical protein n=1 Tax=Candidatus Dormiibacter inghamiae TaxID=3127013 RepID=UPI0030C6C008
MADVQDNVHEELIWNLRALAAAELITEAWAAQAGVRSSVSGLYPSLHLNLGECYRKLGDPDRARHHLRLGRGCRQDPRLTDTGSCSADEYGQLVKAGLDRLAERLGCT